MIILVRSYANRATLQFGQCGGAIIDNQHVATAAHCVTKGNKPYNPSDILVYLGRVNSYSQLTKSTPIASVWIDPRYNPSSLANDFAILTFYKPIRFTNRISPICLPNSEKGISNLIVSGWGVTSSKGEASDSLMEVDVSYMTSKYD